MLLPENLLSRPKKSGRKLCSAKKIISTDQKSTKKIKFCQEVFFPSSNDIENNNFAPVLLYLWVFSDPTLTSHVWKHSQKGTLTWQKIWIIWERVVFQKKPVAPVIWSLFYQLIISPIHGARDIEVSPPPKEGRLRRRRWFPNIFFHGSGNNAPMSGGRAERPPNDDREREFVNSKSNYLGEITFRGIESWGCFERIHFLSEIAYMRKKQSFWR